MDPQAKKTALRMIPYGLYVLTARTQEGKIAAHALNAGKGKRYMKRVPVEAFLQFLLQTDLLPPEFQMEMLLSVIKRLSSEEKKLIIDTLSKKINPKGSKYIFSE